MSQEFKDITDLSYFSINSLQEFVTQSSTSSIATYFTIICIEQLEGTIYIDDNKVENAQNNLVFITPSQRFKINTKNNSATKGFVLQFNKEFYCIDFHDNEISCKGLLFVNNLGIVNIILNKEQLLDFYGICKALSTELELEERLVGEMIRNLLKNLLIKANRLFKTQVFGIEYIEEDTNIVRKFNSLVEENYKELKQVQEYAKLMGIQTKQLTQ